MMGHVVPPQPDDVVAWVTVRCHANGTVSVQGTIGDSVFVKRLLDHARDAVTRQVPEKGLVIPGRDVDLHPDPRLKELGDLGVHERGDP